MTRFDYRQSAFERLIGRRPHVTLDRRVRAGIAAFALACGLVTATAAAERHRLASLDREVAAFHDRLSGADARRRGDVRAAALAERERRLRDAALEARRATLLATNTIARLGNGLPPATWLTSVRGDRAGAWSIAGRSTALAQIGATLDTVARLDPGASARLVSVEGPGRAGAPLAFTIAWDAAP